VILEFFQIRDKEEGEVKNLDNALIDIVDDWQPMLDHLFKIGDVFKVPGRKAKCKLHVS
jgi:hypothetical protein